MKKSSGNLKGLDKIEGFFVKGGKQGKVETSSANFNYEISNVYSNSDEESDAYPSFITPNNLDSPYFPITKKNDTNSSSIPQVSTPLKRSDSTGATNIKIKMTIENETNKEKVVINRKIVSTSQNPEFKDLIELKELLIKPDQKENASECGEGDFDLDKNLNLLNDETNGTTNSERIKQLDSEVKRIIRSSQFWYFFFFYSVMLAFPYWF